MLEKQIVNAVASDFKKTPAGWEQVLFKTGAATKDTIVYSYMQSAAAVTATGRRTVECNASMYFTVPMAGSPTNWGSIWLDIGHSVPADQKSLLLGGEMTAWTDTYCSPRECGAMHEYHPEKGGELYNRSRDEVLLRRLLCFLLSRKCGGNVEATLFVLENSATFADNRNTADRTAA